MCVLIFFVLFPIFGIIQYKIKEKREEVCLLLTTIRKQTVRHIIYTKNTIHCYNKVKTRHEQQNIESDQNFLRRSASLLSNNSCNIIIIIIFIVFYEERFILTWIFLFLCIRGRQSLHIKFEWVYNLQIFILCSHMCVSIFWLMSEDFFLLIKFSFMY